MLHDPYIFGQPIYTKEQLYGRENIIEEIKDNFTNKRRINLLHVQRRIGKTSLITCLPQFFIDEQNIYKFVTFSFQGHKTKPLPKILSYLADDIVATIPGLPKEVREEAHSSYSFFHLFLPKIINEYLSGKKLVLLLDEFDVLEEDGTTDNPRKNLFYELEKTINQEEKLFAILVFGKPLKDMNYLEEFLQKQKPIEVGLLDQENTQNLIVLPAQEILEYEPNAIDEIWRLSAGHPSLTQLLCSNIFRHCREKEITKVTDNEVRLILDKAMEEGEAVLIGFLQPLKEDEQLFFRAVAEAQERPGDEQLQTTIRNWQSVGKRLVEEYGFLEDKTAYKIKVELVRYWLEKKHPLSDEERLQMEQIPEQDQNLHEINKNGKMPTQKENNNPQKPNQIYSFISLLLVFIIIIAAIVKSFFRFTEPPPICNDLLREINSKIASGTSEDKLETIDKFRQEKSLNHKCHNFDEIERKFYELLHKYGEEEVNNKRFDTGIKTWCSIPDKYTDTTQKYITTLMSSNSTLSIEEKIKLINEINKQNKSRNKCPAYSLKIERKFYELLHKYGEEEVNNKKFDAGIKTWCSIPDEYTDTTQKSINTLISSNSTLSIEEKRNLIDEIFKQNESENKCPVYSLEDEIKKQTLSDELNKIDKYYHEQGNYHKSKDGLYNYPEAVKAYCKISPGYSKFDEIQKQLKDWYESEPYVFLLPDDQQTIKDTLKTIRKNNCPAFPDDI